MTNHEVDRGAGGADQREGYRSVSERRTRSSTVVVLVAYACFAAVWIVAGDAVLHGMVGDVAEAQGWQTAKGLSFALMSALVLGWFGVQRDRLETRRKRHEQELWERDRLYRAVFEGSPNVKLLVEPESGAILDANLAAVDFYGYTKVQLLNLSMTHLLALGGEQGREVLARAQEGETRFEHEHRLANGGVRQVECSVGALELNGRGVLYMMVEDVSERRRADLALRVRSTALEAAHNGVVITDRDGLIEWVNEAFTDMTGYTDQEALGVTARELSSGIEGDEFYQELWDTLEAGEVWRGDLRIRRKDGTIYMEEQSVTPVRDEDGEIRHFISIKQDVTERRAAREELERRARQQSALAELGQAALSGREPQDLMQRAVEAVAEVLGVQYVNVLYLRHEEGLFALRAGFGWQEGVVGVYEAENDPSSMAGYIVRCGAPVVVLDLANETRFAPPAVLVENGVVSNVGVLIDYGREPFGILSAHATTRRDFSATDVAFLQGVANVLAAAIRQHRYAQEIKGSREQLLEAYDATIEGWAWALDLRDHETEGHSRRVTDMSGALGRVMGLASDELLALRRGALLHDIGKMGVPDAILHKPGPLTDEEWAIMRSHTVLAKEMLSRVSFLGDAVEVPYSHHEKWDGTGYPQGLAGEEIPLSARIFAVVDVYDALTSDRPYRKAWSHSEALAHIAEQAGTHFDPRVVEAFISLVEVAPRPKSPVGLRR